MDYEVFLLTAFREHWERAGDMTIAVRRGLADTGRLVTAAALIMVVVFGSFLLSENATVKMFGVGLATAVAVDATIVRCLLVPAIMVLAQRAPGGCRIGSTVCFHPCTSKATRERSMPPRRGPPTTGGQNLVGRLPPGAGDRSGDRRWSVVGPDLPTVPHRGQRIYRSSNQCGSGRGSGAAAAHSRRSTRHVPGRAAGYTLGVVMALLVVSLIDAVLPPASTQSARSPPGRSWPRRCSQFWSWDAVWRYPWSWDQ